MKATGIIRRVDDLGRLVIPKEIRRTMRIPEGTALEIFTDSDDTVTLKKYSPVMELRTLAQEYAEGLSDTMNCSVCICDNDTVIAVHHAAKLDYLDKGITTSVAKLIWDKKAVLLSSVSNNSKPILLIDSDTNPLEYAAQAFAPILTNGDPIGCVIAFVKNGVTLNENALCGVKVTAALIAKHIMM